MKKLRFLLFLFILFLVPNVFADTTYDMTSKITSPVNFNECGVGSYTGVELNGSSNCWSTNVRYQGTLNRIYFNLPAPTGNVFESDTAYRLTLNMATNDWRNNFASPVVSPGSSYTNNFVDSFSFVSKKQINITFTVPYVGSTTYQTLYVNIPAKNSSSLITGDTNWNLNKVTLTKLTSGSGGGSSSPSGPSTSFDDTAIINSGKENTQDIINNNNTNTQDIINNNNNNTNELQNTITENLNHCRNSYNLLDPDTLSIGNISTETGQNSNGEFVINSGYISIDNDYNGYSFRYNSYSSSPQIVVYFYGNTKNYIGFDVINSFAGSLLITSNIKFIRVRFNGDFSNSFNFQVEKGSTVHSYEKYGERICSSRLEDIYGAIGAGSQSVIINNNTNTQNVIDNQNENSNKQIESEKVCRNTSTSDISVSNRYLTSNGSLGGSSTYGVSDYINISNSEIKVLSKLSVNYYCFYNNNKSLISCHENNSLVVGNNVTIPSNAIYVRFTINQTNNVPSFRICKNGNQSLDDSINDVNNSLNNSNIDNGVGTGFFDDFTSEDFGLSQIITIPLNTIQSLTSKSCVPLKVPIPFTNSNITLPCMTEIYETKFPSIYNLWKIVSFGIVAYLIAIDIFHIVKGFKDPESDKVEVLDL